MSTGTLPIRTSENIAACAVHGLSFWAEAPDRMLWAVNDKGVAFLVRVNRAQQKSARVVRNSLGEDQDCGWTPFTVPTSLAETAEMLDVFPDPPLPRKETPVTDTVVPPEVKKTRQELNRLKATHISAAEKRASKKRLADKMADRDAKIDALIEKRTAELRAQPAPPPPAPKITKPGDFGKELTARLAAQGLKVVNGQVVSE